MTHRGPFQPRPFCDSVICDSVTSAGAGGQTGIVISGSAQALRSSGML